MEKTYATQPRDPSGLFTQFHQIGWSAFSGSNAQNDEHYQAESGAMRYFAIGLFSVAVVFMLFARVRAITHQSKQRPLLLLGI